MNRDIDPAVARPRRQPPGRAAAARQGRTRRVLAAGLATALVGPLTGGLGVLSGNNVSQFTASPAFRQLWTANTRNDPRPADLAGDRLPSILITRAAPPYQALTGVLVHALTHGFFWLTAWFTAGGCALADVIVLAGLLRRAGRRPLPPPIG
jgi:hypothetical protein